MGTQHLLGEFQDDFLDEWAPAGIRKNGGTGVPAGRMGRAGVTQEESVGAADRECTKVSETENTWH